MKLRCILNLGVAAGVVVVDVVAPESRPVVRAMARRVALKGLQKRPHAAAPVAVHLRGTSLPKKRRRENNIESHGKTENGRYRILKFATRKFCGRDKKRSYISSNVQVPSAYQGVPYRGLLGREEGQVGGALAVRLEPVVRTTRPGGSPRRCAQQRRRARALLPRRRARGRRRVGGAGAGRGLAARFHLMRCTQKKRARQQTAPQKATAKET